MLEFIKVKKQVLYVLLAAAVAVASFAAGQLLLNTETAASLRRGLGIDTPMTSKEETRPLPKRQRAVGSSAAPQPNLNIVSQTPEIDLKTTTSAKIYQQPDSEVEQAAKLAGDHLTIFTQGTPITPQTSDADKQKEARDRLLLKMKPKGSSGGKVEVEYNF